MAGHRLLRRRLALDEGHLSYLVRPGSGPVLILIPGSWHDHRQWEGVVALLGEELCLILIELRGHGESWPPPKDGSIEQFALDVLGVADAMEVERFYGGGHSIGGMVALEVGNVQPKRVKGIISIEGWTHWRALDDAFNGVLKNTLSADQLRRNEEETRRTRARWTEEDRRSFARIWTRWDGYEFLSRTDLPILELWGDRGWPKPSLNRLRIPDRDNIDVRWIEKASHALLLERPREVAGAIVGFIQRVERSRS
jgi:pimeloyl-ACP methyl ester carboxylesterase